MTANYDPFDHPLLGSVANRIINEVRASTRSISRSNRRALIEWE
jgi:hypothetical protein